MNPNLQLTPDGRLRHLLTLEGLGEPLLRQILDKAEVFDAANQARDKKLDLLHGRTVINLFFEASTRTRTTFELAAKRLSADVLNLQVAASSTSKGETLLDTLKTLEAMQADMFVIRHEASGAAHFFAEHAAPGVAVTRERDGGIDDCVHLRADALDDAGVRLPVVALPPGGFVVGVHVHDGGASPNTRHALRDDVLDRDRDARLPVAAPRPVERNL